MLDIFVIFYVIKAWVYEISSLLDVVSIDFKIEISRVRKLRVCRIQFGESNVQRYVQSFDIIGYGFGSIFRVRLMIVDLQ